MSLSSTYTIKLLNKTYTIGCPSQQENNLQLAADKLDAIMRNKQKQFPTLDEHKLLLLAALEISHSTVSQPSSEQAKEEDVTAFIHSLEERLQQLIHLAHKQPQHQEESSV